MSSDPAYALQVAQSAALLGDATVTELVGAAVYDDLAAPASVYPRICLGDDQVLGQTNGCFDPSEIYSTIHLWDMGPGARLSVKKIAGAVRDVFSRPLTLDGHQVVSALFHDARYLTQADPTDPDGLVAHGVLVFYIRTVPANP